MKNEKKSKKIHAWTAKQRGKKGSRRKHGYGKAPKSFCHPFWKTSRARESNEIARFLKGVEESFLNFPYHHKNSATWAYW